MHKALLVNLPHLSLFLMWCVNAFGVIGRSATDSHMSHKANVDLDACYVALLSEKFSALYSVQHRHTYRTWFSRQCKRLLITDTDCGALVLLDFVTAPEAPSVN